MWHVIVPIGASLIGGYLFMSRGKANIGDTVEVAYKPGMSFGDQNLIVQGRVTEKKNPILGPYYTVQIYQLPKVPLDRMNKAEIPVLEGALGSIVPSVLSGLKDSDILRNLSRK